jgi:hypothetical protein
MTKPSTRPVALRTSIVARLFEAMIGRKKGRRSSGGVAASQ